MFKRRIVQLVSMVSVLSLIITTPVIAATYGGGNYGECKYQVSCPVANPPASPPPAGEPQPDTNPAPNTVSIDLDGDGNQEQATDTDGDPNNGYEEFKDPDGSAEVLATPDGEHTGTTTYIIDTNGDGVPDVYWSPSDEYTAPVKVIDDDVGTAWTYVNAHGQLQYYYVSKKEKRQPVVAAPTLPANHQEQRITPDSFGGQVYQKLGDIAKKVPAPVAYSFPYLLLLLIIILVVRLIWQTKRELSRLQTIMATTEREKQLVQEKQNFLMLASHYLRTPITVLKGNIELAQSLKSVPETAIPSLLASATALMTEANAILDRLSQNQALSHITSAPSASNSWRKTLLSPFVIGPLILLVFLLVVVNFIFIDFRVTQPRFLDILVQIALAAILFQWFISSLRKRHINRQNRQDKESLLNKERELDAARIGFIQEATQGLSGQMTNLRQQLDALAASGSDVSRIRKGLDQLSDVSDKFMFASRLQAATVASDKQPFDSTALVQDVVARGQAKAVEKKVTLQPQVQGGQINQNQPLLGMVLDSLVDNAVKYSAEQGTVTLNQQSGNKQAQFSVEDQGQGLTPQQLESLFKPFSRAESVETFNTEGLGFSLYLDRLIMHYLGGEIAISSLPGKGTRAELSVPSA